MAQSHAPAGAHPVIGAPAGAASSQAEESVEVCGVGTVRLPADDATAIDHYLQQLTADVWSRWKDAIAHSPDYRSRAAYLHLAAAGWFTDPGDIALVAAADTLVTLANDTRDPVVYAMALQLCVPGRRDRRFAGCDRISVEGWAAVDPDNAVPWLSVARKATGAQDFATRADALARAAAAHRVDNYDNALLDATSGDIPLDATPLQRYWILTSIVGAQAAWYSPHVRGALDSCTADAVGDPLIRQRCDAVATLFEAHGTGSLDVSLAATLGERVDWSAAKVRALRVEREAAEGVFMQDTGAQWGCESVRTGTALIEGGRWRTSRLQARDVIDSSGMSPAEWAERARQRLKQLMEGASPAAATPTTPAGTPAAR